MAAAQYYEQIQQAYIAYYGRPADPQGLVYWATQLDNAGGNIATIINAFGTSTESEGLYGTTAGAAQISAIYQQLFGRAPDAAGLKFYVNGLAAGTFTLASIALNVYNGATGTDATALAAKLAYADAFTSALEDSVQGQIDYAGNAATANARAALSGVKDDASESAAAAPDALAATIANIGAGTVGQTYTLTTGVDTITLTGNNVVNATDVAVGLGTQNTWNGLDSITGTGTGNTFNVATALAINGMPAGATVSGVQTFNVIESVAAPVALDTTKGFTGLTNLNVTSAGGAVTLNAAATNNVSVTEAPGAGVTANSVQVDGGNNVTVTTNGNVVVGAAAAAAGTTTVTETGTGNVQVESGAAVTVTASGVHTGSIDIGADVTNNGTAAAAVTGAVNVTLNESASTSGVQATTGAINVNGGTTVNVTENIAAPNVTGAIGSFTNTGAAVTVTGAATTTSVTVNQTAAVAPVAGAAAVGVVPPATAQDTVTWGAFATAAAGTQTIGGVTVTSDGSATFTANQVAEVANGGTVVGLTVARVAGWNVTGAADGSSATSTFTDATANTPASLVGTGTFTGSGVAPTAVVVQAGSAGSAAIPAVAAVGGIADGAVTITDVNAGKTTVGTITSVTLNNFSAGATINDNALSSLTLSGKGGAIALNDAGLSAKTAVTTLTLNANAVTGTTVTEQNVIQTLNVVTGGAAASNLAFADTALATVNVSGSQDINLGLTGSTNVKAINVSGAAGITTTLGNAAETFTSTGAGNDVLTIANAVGGSTSTKGYTGNITLGSGNNTLLALDSTTYIANGSTVDGGSSGHNTISASLIANSLGATIENFQTLDVSGFNGHAIDASLLSSPVSGVAISFAGTAGSTLNNLAASVAVTDSFDGAGSLTLTHAGTATDSLAIAFSDATANGSQSLGITSTGDSTVTVATSGAKGVTDTLVLSETDNHLSTVTVSGSNALHLTLALDTADVASTTLTGNVASALTLIDGSAATGALTITAGASVATATAGDSLTFKGLAIHGGIGGDTIENDAANGTIVEGATAANSATNTHINTLTVTGANASINDSASAANDVIHLNGANDSVTLGSGNATVTVGVASTTAWGANVTFGSGTSNVVDSLTFGAGTDTAHANVLTVAGTLSGNEVTFANAASITQSGALGAAATFSGQTTANLTFAQLVQLAAGGASATANTVSWFQFGNNTYVVDTGATASDTTQAQVIKLAGNVDLSHATIDSTTHALHFA